MWQRVASCTPYNPRGTHEQTGGVSEWDATTGKKHDTLTPKKQAIRLHMGGGEPPDHIWRVAYTPSTTPTQHEIYPDVKTGLVSDDVV